MAEGSQSGENPASDYGFFLKFFNNEDHLDALIDGLVYANTPEFYRLSNDPGVSDPHESVVHAYRSERGDRPPVFTIDDHELTGVTSLTLRMSGMQDAWMQSWSMIRMPHNRDELETLVADVERLRQEFGHHYALLPPGRVDDYVRRIRQACEHDVSLVRVAYSSDRTRLNPTCKDTKYEYQREARLLIGQCNERSTDALKIQVDGGFGDLILKNPKVKWTHRGNPYARITWGGPEMFEWAAE